MNVPTDGQPPSGRAFVENWPAAREAILRSGFTCVEAAEGLRQWAASGPLDVGAMCRRRDRAKQRDAT
jgi:hypothetical protein